MRAPTTDGYCAFGIGHALEDGPSGCAPPARSHRRGGGAHNEQFGFSVAGGRIRGHVDGIFTGGPTSRHSSRPCGMQIAVWPGARRPARASAWPNRFMRRRLRSTRHGRQRPGVADNPALFTAINKDTANCITAGAVQRELAQRMSDRAVHPGRDRCRPIAAPRCRPPTISVPLLPLGQTRWAQLAGPHGATSTMPHRCWSRKSAFPPLGRSPSIDFPVLGSRCRRPSIAPEIEQMCLPRQVFAIAMG